MLRRLPMQTSEILPTEQRPEAGSLQTLRHLAGGLAGLEKDAGRVLVPALALRVARQDPVAHQEALPKPEGPTLLDRLFGRFHRVDTGIPAPEAGGGDERERSDPQRHESAPAGLFRDPGELTPPFRPTGGERPLAQAQPRHENEPAIAERLRPTQGIAQGLEAFRDVTSPSLEGGL